MICLSFVTVVLSTVTGIHILNHFSGVNDAEGSGN